MTETSNSAPEFAPEEARPIADVLASAEASKLASGQDIEEEGKRKEHERHQQFRDHVNVATLGLLWLVVASLGLGILVFSFHLLTPECVHFLTEKQLDKLQTLLAAAVLSSALTGYVTRRMA